MSAKAWHVVTGIPSASRSQGVRMARGGHARDPRVNVAADDVRDAFEIVCCDRGDHLYWDYSEISASLQQIRGPDTTMAGALAAYDQHLGLTTSRRRS